MDISESCDGTSKEVHLLESQQQLLSDSQMQCDPIYAPDSNSINVQDVQMAPQNNVLTLPAPSCRQPLNDFMTSGADFDIDSLLLQKFSCLGTTDHEDLINQFQCVMNNQINRETAKFFLEMSNWNLQMAVGCFLDLAVLQTLPSMKILEQTKPNLNQQVWRVQNSGTENWPNGCYLMSTTQERRMDVPALKPGEKCDIVADIPPCQPACMWRLCTPNGWYFGEAIWMIPQGASNTMEDLHQRMSQLITTDQNAVDSTGSAGGIRNTFPQINIVVVATKE